MTSPEAGWGILSVLILDVCSLTAVSVLTSTIRKLVFENFFFYMLSEKNVFELC